MDGPIEEKRLDLDYDRYDLEPNMEFERRADAAGYWFLAAILFAFIAAGVIVYRAGNSEFMTASNDPPATVQSSPADPPATVQTH